MPLKKIAASIEISPSQAADSPHLPGLFPPQTRVYITDVGTDSTATIVAGAKRVAELGYRAVPHFASRRLSTKAALRSRVQLLAEQAGVRDILVIGGGRETPAGDFSSSMAVLETGWFDHYGIKHIAVAGHPEGSPDFSAALALSALKLKCAFAERTDADLRIVTQFGFDLDGALEWSRQLTAEGIELPVHLGVAGPTRLTTLIKFAALCGVGNSIRFLKQRASTLTTLATGFDPETLVAPLEQRLAAQPDATIRQIHVFPFGGLQKSAAWLKQRGSW